MGIFDDIPSSGGRKGLSTTSRTISRTAGYYAAAKQGIGQSIKGIGQAASDFIPGVSPQNPISQYGQSVVDANQTAVNSLGRIVDSPGRRSRRRSETRRAPWAPCWCSRAGNWDHGGGAIHRTGRSGGRGGRADHCERWADRCGGAPRRTPGYEKRR